MVVRHLVRALSLMLGAAAALAADGIDSKTDAEKVLNLYNWSDYIDPQVLEDFSRETGVAIHYEVMDSNELLETKLVAGRAGYDVVFPSAAFLARQSKVGIYLPLDKSRLPNLRHLDPNLTRMLGKFDPGNKHSALYLWGTSGIAYNQDAIASRMPDAPVDSLAMLFDPGIVSRFAECGVSVLDAPSEVIGTVLIYLGKDPNSENLDDLEAAMRVLHSVRPYIRKINSSAYIEDLASGEYCLALGWSGDVIQARNRAEEAAKEYTIEYRIPREGAMAFFDSMAIPAGAEHVRNAHLFIDFMLRPEVASANSRFTEFPSGMAEKWRDTANDPLADPNYFPSAAMQRRLAPDLPESAEFHRQLTRAWTRFRIGK
jgi:putrescine transport system substrate-binding protein